ncbi:hypothetical protein [Clostridium weizhouense]|uniref:Uncharacterized protein n=1 Tax=Clostridium weizhouense TaxID=2859781 RepID=A0ABS7AU16_9CLOT|nr:hypothetical protein [Clostridium weizhouense]MBW6411256.1 hypothetical protein [Clostridium weizhouense]
MGILMTILSFLATLVIVLGIYWVCKKFVFKKVVINKWIALAISIVLFMVQLFLPIVRQIPVLQIILSLISVIFFLWFMYIERTGGAKGKEKKIVIKPKAKPNRVKHLNKQENKKK